MSSPPPGRSLRIAAGVVLIVLVVGAPLAIGTVHDVTRAVAFSLCALALALTLLERLVAGKRFPVTIPLVALGAALLFTALQLVPLPRDTLAWLSPAAHDIFQATLADHGAHAISLDPSATLRELIKLGAYVAFFAAACTYASRPHRRRQLLLAVAGVSALVATIGLIQAATGTPRILFFYEPVAAWEALVRGTFVNSNHFAALMCLGAPCALVLGLREPRLRFFAFAATLVINVAVVLSLSRAGIVAALLGQAMLFTLDRLQLSRGDDWVRDRQSARAALAIVVVLGLGISAVVGASRLRPELARSQSELANPYSKINAWKRGAEVVWQYPWTGVGRGAFEHAFTQVDDRGGQQRYPWIENGYLQSAADFGVPAAVLLFLLAGWGAVLAFRRLDDDPLAVGALTGIVALGLQQGADFAVELPGVALPALAVLATLFGKRASEVESGRRRLAVPRVALAVPVALVVGVFLVQRVPSADEELATLMRAVRDPSVSTAEVLRLGVAARERHPAHAILHAVVGERLARERHPDTMAWLSDAMFLNPSHPAAHLMAAEVLAVTGRKTQALVEYKAAAVGARDPAEIWQVARRRFPDVAELLLATPATPRHRRILAGWLAETGKPEQAERAFLALLELAPGDVRAHRQLALLALARNDAAAAATRVDQLLALDQTPPSLHIAVRQRTTAGDHAGAAKLLDETGLTFSRETFDLELALAAALAAAARPDDARVRLDALARTHPLDRPARVRLHETLAELERGAGHEHQSKWHLEQAARLRSP